MSLLEATDGLVRGTPHALPPEVLCGKPPSFQTDIYSLGVLYYEMLTKGFHPYGITDEVDINFFSSFRCPLDFNGDIPEALVEVMRKAVHKEESQRYRNVKCLKNEIQRATPFED